MLVLLQFSRFDFMGVCMVNHFCHNLNQVNESFALILQIRISNN